MPREVFRFKKPNRQRIRKQLGKRRLWGRRAAQAQAAAPRRNTARHRGRDVQVAQVAWALRNGTPSHEGEIGHHARHGRPPEG